MMSPLPLERLVALATRPGGMACDPAPGEIVKHRSKQRRQQ